MSSFTDFNGYVVCWHARYYVSYVVKHLPRSPLQLQGVDELDMASTHETIIIRAHTQWRLSKSLAGHGLLSDLSWQTNIGLDLPVDSMSEPRSESQPGQASRSSSPPTNNKVWWYWTHAWVDMNQMLDKLMLPSWWRRAYSKCISIQQSSNDCAASCMIGMPIQERDMTALQLTKERSQELLQPESLLDQPSAEVGTCGMISYTQELMHKMKLSNWNAELNSHVTRVSKSKKALLRRMHCPDFDSEKVWSNTFAYLHIWWWVNLEWRWSHNIQVAISAQHHWPTYHRTVMCEDLMRKMHGWIDPMNLCIFKPLESLLIQYFLCFCVYIFSHLTKALPKHEDIGPR